MKNLYKQLLAAFLFLGLSHGVFAQGESSTYFNVFVPPNADAVRRNVCLVVTAVFDSTSFEIIDDGMDGDTDDSKSGMLAQGQSYVLYIADNGINDDARYASGGVLKQDGDYFIVHSNKNVLVSQSTNSDWQHDFVPAIGQKGIGERFFVYAPQISSSKRDLNTFVYEDSTLITIKKISATSTATTGFTNIDYDNAKIVGTQLLNRGQDIIYFGNLGRDVMETGHTYMVEATKPITLQYGALFGNERDGGGNVPSSNGSSSGELFYFSVPYQAAGEQEIRIVSWDNANTVTLERYNAGNWTLVKTWSLNRFGFSDWVGKNNGNASYPTVFRITATAGKRVSVFEANWLETGSPGTSDIGSMLTSESGTSAGKKFIAYMAPPGNEFNVLDPFTTTMFNKQLTHLYISTRTGANVTVKDVYTNGADFSRTYTIGPERYVDCALSLQEWKNIYNGTGSTSGPERPYLIVESDQPVSVFNTNFNDNWMAYLGTAQHQDFSLRTETPNSAVIPGDISVITTQVIVNTASPVNDATATVVVEGNIQIVSSTLTSTSGWSISGTLDGTLKKAYFKDLPVITASGTYTFETVVSATVSDNKGNLYTGNSVGTITSQVSGTVDGNTLQAVSSEGIFVNSANYSQLMFSPSADASWSTLLSDSWTASLIDYDNDYWDDIFIADENNNHTNYLLRNNGNRTFTSVTTGKLVTDHETTIAGTWGDIDNDSDLDVLVVNNTMKPNKLYLNNGNGSFSLSTTPGFVQQPGYYHSGAWIDYDNDGLADLFLCNYWPTKLNELWHNDGNGNFSLQTNSLLSQTPGNAVTSSWADYDNDGLMDVFLPNNKGGKNLFFHNEGNGKFSAVDNIISNDGGNSVAGCWGDINGDGYADLFVSNASNRNNYLYINHGNGNFEKVTAGPVVNDGGNSHGCSFADIDNDGDLDLYVNDDRGPKFLYLNDGNGTFSRRTNEVIAANYGHAMGHAWADLDRDGDLDLFSVTHSNERNWLFWNNGNSNNWLQIKLVGMESNKSAIGARLRLKAAGKWSSRQITSQSGIGGQGSFRVHFGMGDAAVADSLTIYWPSGVVQVLTNIPVNQNLVINEETGKKITMQFFADTNGNCTREANEVYLTNQPIRIMPLNLMAITDANGTIQPRLSQGDYTFNFLNTVDYSANCSGTSMNIVVGTQDIDSGKIGLTPACNCSNASVSLYTIAMRRGFGNDCHILVANTGTTATDGLTVKLSVPKTLNVSHSSPAWSNVTPLSGSTQYTWNVPALSPGEHRDIVVRDSVNLGFAIGDEILMRVEVSASAGETALADNTNVYTFEVVGAIDPNMLAATPRGVGEQRLIEAQEKITYQVYFENIGNYPTSFVTIRDTLSELLDLTSLGDIRSSHGPVHVEVQGNVATFFLPEARLAPSAIDSISGNGYLQFAVRTRAKASGSLANRAAIVFDYSEPVLTNAVTHTVFDKGNRSGSLVLFPNPATLSYTTVALATSGESDGLIETIVVYDTRGIRRKMIAESGTLINLELNELPNGVYIVCAQAGDKKIYTKKLVIAH